MGLEVHQVVWFTKPSNHPAATQLPLRDPELKGDRLLAPLKMGTQNWKTKRSDPVDSLWATEATQRPGRPTIDSPGGLRSHGPRPIRFAPIRPPHGLGPQGTNEKILWMVAISISHPFETMGNHCLLAFAGESPIRGFLGGAGFRPSTVCPVMNSFQNQQGKIKRKHIPKQMEESEWIGQGQGDLEPQTTVG